MPAELPVPAGAELPPDLLRSLAHLAMTTPYSLHGQWIPLAQSVVYAAAHTYRVPITAADLLGLLTTAAEHGNPLGWRGVCGCADALLAIVTHQKTQGESDARNDPGVLGVDGSRLDSETRGHRSQRLPRLP